MPSAFHLGGPSLASAAATFSLGGGASTSALALPPFITADSAQVTADTTTEYTVDSMQTQATPK